MALFKRKTAPSRFEALLDAYRRGRLPAPDLAGRVLSELSGAEFVHSPLEAKTEVRLPVASSISEVEDLLNRQDASSRWWCEFAEFCHRVGHGPASHFCVAMAKRLTKSPTLTDVRRWFSFQRIFGVNDAAKAKQNSVPPDPRVSKNERLLAAFGRLASPPLLNRDDRPQSRDRLISELLVRSGREPACVERRQHFIFAGGAGDWGYALAVLDSFCADKHGHPFAEIFTTDENEMIDLLRQFPPTERWRVLPLIFGFTAFHASFFDRITGESEFGWMKAARQAYTPASVEDPPLHPFRPWAFLANYLPAASGDWQSYGGYQRSAALFLHRREARLIAEIQRWVPSAISRSWSESPNPITVRLQPASAEGLAFQRRNERLRNRSKPPLRIRVRPPRLLPAPDGSPSSKPGDGLLLAYNVRSLSPEFWWPGHSALLAVGITAAVIARQLRENPTPLPDQVLWCSETAPPFEPLEIGINAGQKLNPQWKELWKLLTSACGRELFAMLLRTGPRDENAIKAQTVLLGIDDSSMEELLAASGEHVQRSLGRQVGDINTQTGGLAGVTDAVAVHFHLGRLVQLIREAFSFDSSPGKSGTVLHLAATQEPASVLRSSLWLLRTMDDSLNTDDDDFPLGIVRKYVAQAEISRPSPGALPQFDAQPAMLVLDHPHPVLLDLAVNLHRRSLPGGKRLSLVCCLSRLDQHAAAIWRRASTVLLNAHGLESPAPGTLQSLGCPHDSVLAIEPGFVSAWWLDESADWREVRIPDHATINAPS